MIRWTFNFACGKNYTQIIDDSEMDNTIQQEVTSHDMGRTRIVELFEGAHIIYVNMDQVTCAIRTDLDEEKRLKDLEPGQAVEIEPGQ